MTSEYEAPDGATPPVPPPPPASGQVPPPPPPPPPAPGPVQSPPAAPSAPPPPPPPVPVPPPPAPVPPPPPATAAVPPAPAPPPPSHPPVAPASASEPTQAAVPAPTAPAPADDDLADILARLDDEPKPTPDTLDGVPETSAAAASAPAIGEELTDPRDLERPSTASDIVIESDGGIDFDPTFASFDKRTLELVIDITVVGLVLIPGLLLAALGGAMAVLGALVVVLGFVLVTVLAARSVASTGQWIGNRVADTRIVDGINGSNINMGRAALRFVVRFLVSTILLLGFLIAFTDGQRRTFHDRIAGTVVIGRPREVWTADDSVR